jgi:parvulin-like peptidyl-prolyl isomerase
MTALRRALRGPVAVAVVAAPVALAACHPVHPGAAAIVGTHAISVDTLQRLTNRVLAATDAQTKPQVAGDAAALARLQRNILTRLIDNDLLDTAARTFGVRATESEIDQERAQLAQQAGGDPQLLQQAVLSGIAPGELRSALRGLVLGNKIADAVVANETVSPAQLQAAYQQNIDQFDQVHLAELLVPTKAQADSLLAQARAKPSEFGALVARFSQDTTSRSNGGDLGLVGQSRLPDFARPAFDAKPGAFLEVHGPTGWYVFHVIAHPRVSITAAASQLRTTILQSLSQQRVADLLTRTARGLHITVSPRYGKWSIKDRAVNAPPDDLSKPVATPTPVQTLPTGTGQPPSG